MKINYVVGDATQPIGEEMKIIVHCCNDVGGWGSGFVLALNRAFGTVNKTHILRSPREEYLTWYRKKTYNFHPFKLGQIQTVRVGDELLVCNLIGQSDYGSSFHGLAPVRYGAIEEGLLRLRERILDSETVVSLHMPRMGCGLAGGKWEKIEEILIRVFENTDIDITVYDLPEK